MTTTKKNARDREPGKLPCGCCLNDAEPIGTDYHCPCERVWRPDFVEVNVRVRKVPGPHPRLHPGRVGIEGSGTPEAPASSDPKFKVGSRVQITDGKHIGRTGFVNDFSAIPGRLPQYWVTIDTKCTHLSLPFLESMLEGESLVKSEEETGAPKFKDGDRVRITDGRHIGRTGVIENDYEVPGERAHYQVTVYHPCRPLRLNFAEDELDLIERSA